MTGGTGTTRILGADGLPYAAPHRRGSSDSHYSRITETNRLNEAHWQDALDEPINSFLAREIKGFRARAQYEFLHNPIIKGMTKTYRDDVIGSRGPSLSVQSDDSNYNESLEQVWVDWWARPDINGVHSGADLLALTSYSVWTTGDYFLQLVMDPDATGPVALRLLMIHPRRVSTPFDLVSDPDIVMGIRRTRTGRPIEYFVEEAPRGELSTMMSLEYTAIPASDIIHWFEFLEVDQARGMPWLASALRTIQTLRDYDDQVMAAARMAAAFSVMIVSTNPDAPYFDLNETTTIEPGEARSLPPGWEPKQMIAQQPANTYKEFRSERMREMGRPVGMPLMTINLDATGHSWSSARLDRDVYHSGIRVGQGAYERTGLNRLVDAVAREAELSIGLRRPDRVAYVWSWPVFSSVDPVKDGKAATERLTNGTSTLQAECAVLGKDWDEVLTQQAREQKRRKELGLPDPLDRGSDDDGDDEDDMPGRNSNGRAQQRTGDRMMGIAF